MHFTATMLSTEAHKLKPLQNQQNSNKTQHSPYKTTDNSDEIH